MEFNSHIIQKAVESLSSFPGIGKRSALRMVMHLLKRPHQETIQMADALIQLKTELKICKSCFNVADTEICNLCKNPRRESDLLCVVENFNDQLVIENTAQYRGLYFILGGLISPMDGIGPEELNLESLVQRCASGLIKEVILAFSATTEADTTMFYVTKKLQSFPAIKISTLARGIAIGGELQYADEITLARSITNRIEYKI